LTTDQTVRSVHPLEALIDTAFEARATITPSTAERALLKALDHVIDELNAGTLRVAEKRDGTWVTNQWIKKAVLLYFRTHDNEVMPDAGGGAKHAVATRWFDKVPVKFDNSYSAAQFREGGVRVVPPATVRTGTFIGKSVVLMPSYVNIGAYVDEGTMVDTWATGGFVRPDRQERPPVGWRRHRRRARAAAGQPHDHRGQLLYRRAVGDCRRRDRRAHSVISMGVFIGRARRSTTGDGGDPLWPRALGLGGGAGQPAVGGRQVLACLCRDREARGRSDARQDLDQRAPARPDGRRPTNRRSTREAAHRLPFGDADDAGCMALLGARLAAAGSPASGWIAAGPQSVGAPRHGAPLVCLAGHVDVVPPGRSSGGRATRSRPPSATASCSAAAPPT
jgi:hypothetical protein